MVLYTHFPIRYHVVSRNNLAFHLDNSEFNSELPAAVNTWFSATLRDISRVLSFRIKILTSVRTLASDCISTVWGCVSHVAEPTCQVRLYPGSWKPWNVNTKLISGAIVTRLHNTLQSELLLNTILLHQENKSVRLAADDRHRTVSGNRKCYRYEPNVTSSSSPPVWT